MLERAPKRERGLQIGVATANTFGVESLQHAVREAGHHVAIARKAGLDGIELWPQHPLITAQLKTGWLTEETKTGILSVHQSPRTEEIRNIKQSPKDILAIAALPSKDGSLSYLEQVREKIGDVHAVLYHDAPSLFLEQTNLTQKGVQIYPELTAEWQVMNTKDLQEKMKKKGFTHIVYDITHARRKHRQVDERSSLSNWEQIIPELMQEGIIGEIHVAVGRLDPGTVDAIGRQKTLDELKDLLNGTQKTEAMAMLQLLKEQGWKGLTVIELMGSALKEVGHIRNKLLSKKDLISAYSAMGANLRQLFNR